MSIIDKLEEKDPNKCKEILIEIIKEFLTPAFGSIQKRDLEISIFQKLQNLGVIDKNPELYELIGDLRVTRSKARNLLYDAKIRSTSEGDLDTELKLLLRNPIFLDDGDKKISLEIENPYLTDHFRSKLKKLRYLTNQNFSPELITLTIEAYSALLESELDEEVKKRTKEALIQSGAKKELSFKSILIGALKKVGGKVADEAGDQLAEAAGEYIGPLIDGSVDLIKKKYNELFTGSS
ncbi:MAG: hypothetical protein AAFY41_08840 [Bacteroidota bacterium]